MQLFIFAIFLSTILALCYIDFKAKILPDFLTFSLLWTGLLVNPLLGWISLYNAILGVVIGYLCLFGIYLIFKYFRQKEGLGFGDFKLLAALGAWFGWEGLPLILFIATSSTLLVLLILKILRKYPLDPRIPMGPGLCFAGLIIYLTKCLTLF